jgi:hypothetical protein
MAKKSKGEKRAPKGANGEKKSKADQKKKKEPSQLSAGDVKFGSHIAKKHKSLQNPKEDGDGRTISADAVHSLEMMTDHLINQMVGNSKNVLRYTKITTFNLESAKAAVNLTLAGRLRKSASAAGVTAFEKYKASLPAPAAAPAAAPVAEPAEA